MEDRGVEIIFNNGTKCLCSSEDHDMLKNYTWRLSFDKKYATASVDGKNIFMHRLLLKDQLNDELYVDHRNNVGLDNRRSNIRVCTPSQNSMNRKKGINAGSSFYGVFFQKERNNYRVAGRLNGEEVYIGICENERDAAILFDLWTVKQDDFKDDFRRLNFPGKLEEYTNGLVTIETKKPSKKPRISDYMGVHKNGRVFTAKIVIKKKTHNIFNSVNQLLCAKAYDKYIVDRKLDKELNFPEDYPNYEPELPIKTLAEFENGVCKIRVKDKIVLIDEADYNIVKHFILYLNKYSYVQFTHKGKAYILHRYLLDVKNRRVFIDHINNDKCDNRRLNLRLSNALKNSRNRNKIGKKCSSDYKGVSKRKSSFYAVVKLNNKTHSKAFKIEENAARYRDLYIKRNLENPTFKFNFEWTEDTVKEWEQKLFK